MKNTLVTFMMLFWVTSSLLSQSSAIVDTNTKAAKIDKLMQYSFENGMFNGVILVSQASKPIYKNAFGYADKSNNRKLNKASVFYLASVSKQFTAMAIMILKEQKKLSYNDKLSRYFPEFPGYADTVAIKHLMTHTSGIADHYRLGIYKKGLTNRDVKKVLVKQSQLDFQPGDKFSYSNGGYVLLSLIVEKASGVPFHKFMENNIFMPLGMKNTLVYDESAPNIENRAIGYNQIGELDDYEIFTTGAGGMFSTLEDLHLWDQALYSEKLIPKSTLEEAFTPATLNNGESTNYGYGWGVSEKDGHKIVQHSGGLSGYRTFLKRNLYYNSGYIILTNHGDAFNNSAIRNALDDILEGKPFTLPRIPISNKMGHMLMSNDVTATMKKIRALLDSEQDKFEVDESAINRLGYYYLGDKDFEKALGIFKFNVDYNPLSSNVYDSFGEALLASGDTLKSIKNYKKSLELNGNNTNAIDALKRVGINTDGLVSKVMVPEEQLQQYVGKYQLSPNFIITILKEGNRLFIHPTGQSKSEVFASSQNRFYSKIVNAQITFNKNENDKVLSLTLHQNGNKEAKKIE
ncbi:MAG: serine hydrolase [Maribacter sp.]|nr:serine hydrolase [Maribacter sp.]